MSAAPFGAGYSEPGADPDAALLGYLDAVAAVDAFATAKRDATATLDLRAGDRVLDLGCGTGVDLPLLSRLVGAGGAVLGVDTFPAALDAAARRMAADGNVTLHHGQAAELPLPDASVDAARVDRVLQHVEATDVALAELHRVLRPGGRLVVLEVGNRLEVPGADPAVTTALTRRLMDLDRGQWVPLWLPVLLAGAGFAAVAMTAQEATSARYADADAVLRLEPAVAESVRDGSLDPDAAQTWRDAAHAAEAAGTLRLTMRFIRFSATAA